MYIYIYIYIYIHIHINIDISIDIDIKTPDTPALGLYKKKEDLPSEVLSISRCIPYKLYLS